MIVVILKGVAGPDACGLWIDPETQTIRPSTPCCGAKFLFTLFPKGGHNIVCEMCANFMPEDVTDDYVKGKYLREFVLDSICKWLDLDPFKTKVEINWH